MTTTSTTTKSRSERLAKPKVFGPSGCVRATRSTELMDPRSVRVVVVVPVASIPTKILQSEPSPMPKTRGACKRELSLSRSSLVEPYGHGYEGGSPPHLKILYEWGQKEEEEEEEEEEK
ncbi:hypothetical protein M0802_010033 [Mischocyttarus mexicanus]|nr:hypothetical protein M0802_010033 [Mischocyttarus mexicanus]